MTVKRNFKRRVRERQTRTGESYMTARRHLLASRPTDPGDDEGGDGDEGDVGDDGTGAPPSTISVVELIDVSEAARRAGLVCRTLMYPPLPERIAQDRVLAQLHDLLVATADDPATARLSQLALGGTVTEPRIAPMFNTDTLRRFLRRARAGLGGTLDDGATLAFHVPDGDGLVPIMCTLSARGTAIELSAIDSVLPHAWEPLAPLLALEQRASGSPPTRALVDTLTASLLGVGRVKTPWPLLRAVYGGRDYPVIRAPFVIGRSAVCDLAIDGDGVADEHAAVVLLDDAVYLKDLGSPAGVVYRGRRIGHKRIDEGDVFHICGHEISFTFRM